MAESDIGRAQARRTTSATANGATAAIAIGLTLAVVHLVGIPITGTSVNPARSLGPALIVTPAGRGGPVLIPGLRGPREPCRFTG